MKRNPTWCAAFVCLLLSLGGVAGAATQDGREAPRRLLISVTQDARQDTRQSRTYETGRVDEQRVVQTVQALEGRSAFIVVGQSRPVPERQVVRSFAGGRVVEHVVEGVDYRNAHTGFYALARVNGDRVTVEITPQREVFVPGRPGAVDSQRVSTTVAGRLGEWIEVAGTSEISGSEREVVLGRAGGARLEARSVLLKVEQVR